MIKARRIVLNGLDNARDLGGFVTEDGRITKFGVFFRSESLFYLESKDVTVLEKYGITGCIDIHGPIDDKKKIHPFQNNPKLNYCCIPILSDLIKHIGTEKDNFKESDWVDVNIRILEVNKTWVKDVITACAEFKAGTIIHCRTGKTRTSLICMIIMLLAKVPIVDIIAEFATTEIYMKNKYEFILKNSFHSEGFYKSPAFVLEKTINHIIDSYGTIESYLNSCGISETSIKKIRNKYISTIY